MAYLINPLNIPIPVTPWVWQGRRVWIDPQGDGVCDVGAEGPWYRVSITPVERLSFELRWRRLEQGITRRAMAEAIGVTPQEASNLEMGRRCPPTDVLIRMGRIVGLDLCWRPSPPPPTPSPSPESGGSGQG